MFAELDYTYKLAKSQFGDARLPTPLDILKMATSDIGNLLGAETPGYLAEGLPADILASVRQGQVLWQTEDAARQPWARV